VRLVDEHVVAAVEVARRDGLIVDAFRHRREAYKRARAAVDAADVKLDRVIDDVSELDDRSRARRKGKRGGGGAERREGGATPR